MVHVSNSITLPIKDFRLRPLQISDLDSLLSIWSDSEVTRFLPSRGKPVARENTEKMLRFFIEHWQQRGYGVWAIVENSSARMVGYCGLRYLEELDDTEVLYGLAKTYWGRGIATQAAKAAVKYGFDVANLNRLIAMALPENIASIGVIEKAGLQYEKQIHMFDLDVLYYSANR